MYLWRSPFRNISSGSDAAILYHEYTHGLSNRLVTDADGAGALNSAEAGAMGEAWSDWYAQDFIVGQFPALDTGAVGRGRHGRVHGFRRSRSCGRSRSTAPSVPIRSAVPAGRRSAPAATPTATSGGSAGGAEVHADGEIWAQTLWDLRTALGVREGAGAGDDGDGAAAARAVVLGRAQRDPARRSDACTAAATLGALWSVFAARGMGFFAAAVGGEDTAPAESFALPPAADGPKGTITGRVTNALGGGPRRGRQVGLARA